ncbi:uncharacterized protein LOC110432301 isoform X2 [Sorghum bicolor]|uniref:uncharacterized protein LOC110432301 isoform X2 n=1 Tax=Sorghum bicolor TaxID=4558 RepID=UPI000B426B68|nr:uncharacterized protein LOC110432301 isoform X2 [Sorghum bicolor]|eukprot:XP_021308088.1 uncharacterized protein LOC110432301 isoform X2 [Sorghum bicolor]
MSYPRTRRRHWRMGRPNSTAVRAVASTLQDALAAATADHRGTRRCLDSRCCRPSVPAKQKLEPSSKMEATRKVRFRSIVENRKEAPVLLLVALPCHAIVCSSGGHHGLLQMHPVQLCGCAQPTTSSIIFFSVANASMCSYVAMPCQLQVLLFFSMLQMHQCAAMWLCLANCKFHYFLLYAF